MLQVLRGYIGDRSSKPVWDGNVAFNILGKGYQRPFELATLRLNHMVNILPRCESLAQQPPSVSMQKPCAIPIPTKACPVSLLSSFPRKDAELMHA